MKAFTFLLAMLACAMVFADLDYKQLSVTKRDQPGTVTITGTVTIRLKFGEFEIPKNSMAKVLTIMPDGTLEIEFNGKKYVIPADKTDLEKRVTEIRSHRIVIDGTEYVDFEFTNPTVYDVTMTYRSGVMKVPLEKLSPELQKRFSYDPQKAAAWFEAEKQRLSAEQRKAEEEKRFKEKLINIEGKVVSVIEGKGVILSNIDFVRNDTIPPVPLMKCFLECDTKNLVDGQNMLCCAYREGTYTYTSVSGASVKVHRWVYYGPYDRSLKGTEIGY